MISRFKDSIIQKINNSMSPPEIIKLSGIVEILGRTGTLNH
jgi:hypothetical protein